MTKIYELEYEFRRRFEDAIADLEWANDNADFKSLEEVVEYGFNCLQIFETDGSFKYGYEKIDFEEKDLNRKVRYLNWDWDTDGYRYVMLEFVNADELCDK